MSSCSAAEGRSMLAAATQVAKHYSHNSCADQYRQGLLFWADTAKTHIRSVSSETTSQPGG